MVQKILTNPVRNPPEKREKDIASVKELLFHIQKVDYHKEKLGEVCSSLTKKQLKTLKTVCEEYKIVFCQDVRKKTMMKDIHTN